jgi:hypothetical protein
MNATEKYHKKWIKDIAKRTSPTRIKRHIIRHAKDVSNPRQNNPISWLSSMYNLIQIYEGVYNVKPNHSVQVYKLLLKYTKHPRNNTPPPGNKIPKSVKIKKVIEKSI